MLWSRRRHACQSLTAVMSSMSRRCRRARSVQQTSLNQVHDYRCWPRSPGIVLVAFSPPEASTALLASAKITRFTEYTIIDRDVLERVVE